MTEDKVLALLAEARQLGICKMLVMGGPPNVPPPAAGSGRFASTTELVSFVKQRLGERVRVAVCGIPRTQLVMWHQLTSHIDDSGADAGGD